MCSLVTVRQIVSHFIRSYKSVPLFKTFRNDIILLSPRGKSLLSSTKVMQWKLYILFPSKRDDWPTSAACARIIRLASHERKFTTERNDETNHNRRKENRVMTAK